MYFYGKHQPPPTDDDVAWVSDQAYLSSWLCLVGRFLNLIEGDLYSMGPRLVANQMQPQYTWTLQITPVEIWHNQEGI